MKTKNKLNKSLWGNKILWTVLFTIVGILLTWVRLIVLTEGGELTYFSMLVVYLAGYIIGWKEGFISAFLVGLARYFMEYSSQFALAANNSELANQIYAEIWDIILAYTLIAFGGLLVHIIEKHKWDISKYALQIGFVVGVLLKFIENVWNVLFFYPPTQETFGDNLMYAFVYCGGSIGIEILFSIVVLFVPAMIRAIDFLRLVARTKYEENYDLF